MEITDAGPGSGRPGVRAAQGVPPPPPRPPPPRLLLRRLAAVYRSRIASTTPGSSRMRETRNPVAVDSRIISVFSAEM